MQEIVDWLMKPMVKINSPIQQDNPTVYNSSLNSYYPLSSTCLDSLYYDPLLNLLHQLVFHTLLIFVLLDQTTIRYKTITLLGQRSKKAKILSTFVIFVNIFHVNIMCFHSLDIVNLLILVLNQMQSMCSLGK